MIYGSASLGYISPNTLWWNLINLWQTADKLVINSTCMLCTDIFGVTNIRQSPEWFMRWRSAKNTNLSKSATAEPNMLKIFIQNIIKHFSHPFPFSASQSGRKTWSFQNWIIIPCRWRWGAENCCRIRIILLEIKRIEDERCGPQCEEKKHFDIYNFPLGNWVHIVKVW